MAKTGLVLEGGGQRGIYTAGVLDVFMDNDIEVDGVIGVSAGAIHGLSYVTRQRGRNMRYNMKYRNNKHYMSMYSLITTGDAMYASKVMPICPFTTSLTALKNISSGTTGI